MLTVVGLWFALSGLVAFLPWVGGVHRRHRLRAGERTAWATVVPAVPAAAPAGRPAAQRINVRFSLDDGRVIERPCPRPARKSSGLIPGEKVLIWYDPADPGDILVPGRDGHVSEEVFLLVGLVLLATGLAAVATAA